MASAAAGIAGTPKLASATPPSVDPRACPTAITEPLSASATGAPAVIWISRVWITGVIENSAVAARKIASATRAWLGRPGGRAWWVAAKWVLMAIAWMAKPCRIQARPTLRFAARPPSQRPTIEPTPIIAWKAPTPAPVTPAPTRTMGAI